MESLETLNAKIKKMEEAKDMCVNIYISLPEDSLSKPKDELVTELKVEHEKYILNVKESKTGYEELVCSHPR